MNTAESVQLKRKKKYAVNTWWAKANLVRTRIGTLNECVSRSLVRRWRKNVFYCLAIKLKHFWCRCGWGTHPFPSRTRRLRPNRPMVLHWRRCGRAGGRQIKKKTTGWKPDEDKTGIGKWVLSETGWSQIRIVKSGANPYQPGRAVKICWFYQWLEILKEFKISNDW